MLSFGCSSIAWADSVKGSLEVGDAKLSYAVENGEATITKIEHVRGSSAGTYEVSIPESITIQGQNGATDESYLVTAIADSACGTSVTKEVDNSYDVVENAQITRIILPSKLLSVGNSAFAGCTALTHVEFAADAEGAQHLQSIGDYAFYGSAIDEAIIPDTVTTIGLRAFAKCENARKIHLPASQLVIDAYAFDKSENFTSIEIPEGCTAMPRITMSQSVDEITIPSSMTGAVYLLTRTSSAELETLNLPAEMGNASLSLNVGSAAIYAGGVKNSLPEGVETLSVSGSFETLKLPSTLRYVEGVHSNIMTRLAIPKSVIELRSSCLARNPMLESVTFEAGSDLATVRANAFSYCPSLEQVELPDNVNRISNCFVDCDSLTYVSIPSGVVVIGDFPFDGCDNLESIEFESGARQMTLDITGLARACPKLKRVVLPDAATPHTINATTQYFKFLEDCPALEGIYTYDPDLVIDESWVSGCGSFKVFGWGRAGAVLDFAENSGHEFVPYAELDDSGYNGRANTQVRVTGVNEVSAETAFSLPTSADYVRTLAEGVDYDLVREGPDDDAYLVVSGKADGDGPQTCFGEARLPVGRDIDKAFVLPIADQLFLGDAVCPVVRASWQDGTVLKAGRDYLVTYEGNDAPGMASATLIGMGSYAGTSKTVGFRVVGTLVSTGDDRVANALSAARQAFGSEGAVDTAVLAWSHDYASIFAADAYAAAANAPIVLTSNSSLDAEVKRQLASWGVGKVVAVGDIVSLSAVLGELSAAGMAVDSVGGDVSSKLFDRGASEGIWADGAVVANPSDLAECMLASAYAASMRTPLVYVEADGTLPQSLSGKMTAPVTIVGDFMRVDASVEADLGDSVAVRVEGVEGEMSTALGNLSFGAGTYSDGALVRVVLPSDVTAYATWPATAAALHVPLIVAGAAEDASVAAFFSDHASRIAGYEALGRTADASCWNWLIPTIG